MAFISYEKYNCKDREKYSFFLLNTLLYASLVMYPLKHTTINTYGICFDTPES